MVFLLNLIVLITVVKLLTLEFKCASAHYMTCPSGAVCLLILKDCVIGAATTKKAGVIMQWVFTFKH